MICTADCISGEIFEASFLNEADHVFAGLTIQHYYRRNT